MTCALPISPLGRIHDVVNETQAAMAEASRVVLDGFELRSDAKVVTHPDRYADERGEKMWQTATEILRELIAERKEEMQQAAAF